jgi:hypothetical protein
MPQIARNENCTKAVMLSVDMIKNEEAKELEVGSKNENNFSAR